MKLQRIVALAWKEWREIVRDRLFFALAFIVPTMLMLLFGFGLTLDVENLPFAVVDHDRSAASRDYTYRFISSRYFDFKGQAGDERQLDTLLADNRIRLALVIPPRFGERLAGRGAPVQVLIDGTFPMRAQTTQGYVAAINSAVSLDNMAQALSAGRGVPLARPGPRPAGEAGGALPLQPEREEHLVAGAQADHAHHDAVAPFLTAWAWCARRSPAPSSTSTRPPCRRANS
jgi:ABC-2 type transport system permease protein/ribosome-dependent ATPase